MMQPLKLEDEDGETFVGVRIPIAVNSKGEWVAFGKWHHDKAEGFAPLVEECLNLTLGAFDVHYVYARVPVHKHRVYGGTVE